MIRRYRFCWGARCRVPIPTLSALCGLFNEPITIVSGLPPPERVADLRDPLSSENPPENVYELARIHPAVINAGKKFKQLPRQHPGVHASCTAPTSASWPGSSGFLNRTASPFSALSLIPAAGAFAAFARYVALYPRAATCRGSGRCIEWAAGFRCDGHPKAPEHEYKIFPEARARRGPAPPPLAFEPAYEPVVAFCDLFNLPMRCWSLSSSAINESAFLSKIEPPPLEADAPPICSVGFRWRFGAPLDCPLEGGGFSPMKMGSSSSAPAPAAVAAPPPLEAVAPPLGFPATWRRSNT